MKCVRCGAELKDTDRVCIRCGTVNYNNQENESYVRKYGDTNEIKATNPGYMNKKIGLFSKILLAIMIVIIIAIIIYLYLKNR